MSAGAIVAIVFVVIFVIGVIVGIVVVVALSAVRREQRLQGRPAREWHNPARINDPSALDEPEDEITGATGVPGHWDGVRGGERPRWPGDTDNEYSG